MVNYKNSKNFLYNWNPSLPEHLQYVQIEDDIRDGIQGAYTRKPSLEEKKELLNLTASIGTHEVLIGFPATSQREFDECRELVHHIQHLPLLPRFLARALVEDIKPIVALNQAFERDVWADFFINVSPIRRKVENWDINTQLERIQAAGKYLSSHNTKFGVSFEDTSRTSPEELTLVIEAALEAGAKRLAICDTVGDCTPEGAMKLTQFFLKFIKKSAVKVIWHGHNDKGLGMANAIAAAQAGAHIISGTFLGIGERAGNTPLEQVIMFLFQAGSQQFNLKRIQAYCEKLAEYTHTPIPSTAPLVGGQAFATSAGTHSAAILKARQLGIDFEDAIFSSVPASKLGRIQEIVIGPTSGMANARYLLEQIGITVSEELTHQLLAYAKSKDRWLTSEDIRHYLNATSNGDTL